MKIQHKSIDGVALIQFISFSDERGSFTPLYSCTDFQNHGLHSNFQRINQSYSKEKGTLRGLHYQTHPHSEAKLIRVLQGEIWDVALDIRSSSEHFGRYEAVHLKENDNKMFLIPSGCAHGFLTLTENVVVEYLCSGDYIPTHERSIRWNDPFFSIDWPIEAQVLSPKDLDAPDFDPKYHLWKEHSHYDQLSKSL